VNDLEALREGYLAPTNRVTPITDSYVKALETEVGYLRLTEAARIKAVGSAHRREDRALAEVKDCRSARAELARLRRAITAYFAPLEEAPGVPLLPGQEVKEPMPVSYCWNHTCQTNGEPISLREEPDTGAWVPDACPSCGEDLYTEPRPEEDP